MRISTHPILGREVPPSGSPNVPDGFLRALRSLLIALSHRLPPRGDDEPETLSYAISSNCPVGPDGEQDSATTRSAYALKIKISTPSAKREKRMRAANITVPTKAMVAFAFYA